VDLIVSFFIFIQVEIEIAQYNTRSSDVGEFRVIAKKLIPHDEYTLLIGLKK
jgi:hypothetical protein